MPRRQPKEDEGPKPARPPDPTYEILEYFVRHPAAADSLEGIARWRLMRQRIRKAVVETQEALEWLVSRGYLLSETRQHAASIFRLNPKQREEARRLLRRTKNHRAAGD